ncbi:MAG: hypothetical protein JW832_04530 [Deltaproteobacteria bacterium]|nr:hypothetical protein [Deltaproteobacteria bacterium]
MKTILLSMPLCLSLLMLPAGNSAALCIAVAKANLRTGPGTEYMKSWEVGKYMPFDKVGVSLSGDWYAVKDLDDDVFWVHKKLVDESCRAAVVTADNIAIRTGPGTNHAKTSLGSVSKYYCFQVLEQKPGWVKGRDSAGATGWIHKKFLWMP